MTGRHYNWHRRWGIDLAACTATHDSGLVVKFSEAKDSPGAWDGTPVNAQEWLTGQNMPPRDLEQHAIRI